MRLVNSQRSQDCGPIALYNLLKILRLPGAKGGYQANRARLARATDYRNGVSLSDVKHAIIEEVYTSDFTICIRRPFWRNIPAQLMKAKVPAVGVAVWTMPEEKDPDCAHIAVVWKPYTDDVILCANSQVKYKGIVPFWITYGSTDWATTSHPVVAYGSKLIGFWQVVPRG